MSEQQKPALMNDLSPWSIVRDIAKDYSKHGLLDEAAALRHCADAAEQQKKKEDGAALLPADPSAAVATETLPDNLRDWVTIDRAKFHALIDRDLAHYAGKLVKRALHASLVSGDDRTP